ARGLGSRSVSAAWTRRDLLRAGGAAGVAAGLAGAGVAGAPRAAAAVPSACVEDKLGQVEHIVILIQENRSFDHYFGTFPGVRGFDDRSAPGGVAAFQQH